MMSNVFSKVKRENKSIRTSEFRTASIRCMSPVARTRIVVMLRALG